MANCLLYWDHDSTFKIEFHTNTFDYITTRCSSKECVEENEKRTDSIVFQNLRSIKISTNKLFQKLDVLLNAKIFVKLRFLC